MTEQEVLNTIPDDWAKDIVLAELEQRATEMWPSVALGLAGKAGIQPSPKVTIDKTIAKLAKAHKTSKAKELQSLKDTCLQNSKIDIFTERYGHLFEQDEHGELSYSVPMLRKITGLPL